MDGIILAAAANAVWCVRLEESVSNDGIATAAGATAPQALPATSVFLHNLGDHEEVGIGHASCNTFTNAVEAQLGIFWGYIFWGTGAVGGVERRCLNFNEYWLNPSNASFVIGGRHDACCTTTTCEIKGEMRTIEGTRTMEREGEIERGAKMQANQ